jgi:hypothetical protein
MDKSKGFETLCRVTECAKRAGIGDYHFACFGTLLGIIREGDLMEHDDDIDVGIYADKITQEQEVAYFNEIEKEGLFKSRKKEQRRLDTNRLLWFSCREKDDGVKSCNWLWQSINGLYWHSKGIDWSDKIGARLKPPVDRRTVQAIAKGIRVESLNGLVKIKLKGVEFNIPLNYGSCLDVWYPDWMVKRSGASREDLLLIVPNWKESKTWKMQRR